MDYSRGDIVWVNLEPVRPGEQGRNRPCVIVSHDGINHSRHPCVIVCPLTGKGNVHKEYSSHVLLESKDIGELTKDSIVMTEQIRTIAKSQIAEKHQSISLPHTKVQSIEMALRRTLDML